MAKVTFNDIVALAKAGYTPKDVKELISLEVSETNNPGTAQTEITAEADHVKNDSTQSSAPAAPVNTASAAPKESEPTAAEPDYKALYEAEKEKVNTLQNKNNQIDVSGKNIVTESDLIDLVSSYC